MTPRREIGMAGGIRGRVAANLQQQRYEAYVLGR